MASTIIALDIGEKRIGVATADGSAPFPAPLTTLETSGTLLADFHELIRRHKVAAIVIGLPRNQSGETTQQTSRVQKIASLLQIPEEIPVYWQDESLTSVNAEEELERRKKPYTKADVDALAATYILNDFIQSPAMTELRQQIAHPKQISKTEHTKKKTKKPHSKRKLFVIAAGVLVGLVIAAFISIFSWYQWALSPRAENADASVIVIAEGSSSAQIAQQLHKEQLIKSTDAFMWYLKLNSITNLQAGAYELSGSQSVKEIVETLRSGKVSTNTITILPGKRLDQILEQLQQHGFSQDELQAAISSVRDHELLKTVPSNMKLEGYFFPDTYQLDASMSAEDVLRLLLDTFQKKLTADESIMDGLERQQLTLSQAVVVASIVQNEVRDYEEQQKVAQVFLRRLNEGIPLGADPTFRYAAAVEGGVSNPSNPSRYNTRLHAGLPPSAISNFNISALKAVANPSSTTYLYFVAGDDGTTHFSHTLEEHQSLTQRYCTTLCQ